MKYFKDVKNTSNNKSNIIFTNTFFTFLKIEEFYNNINVIDFITKKTLNMIAIIIKKLI